jgi:hypothetical protein
MLASAQFYYRRQTNLVCRMLEYMKRSSRKGDNSPAVIENRSPSCVSNHPIYICCSILLPGIKLPLPISRNPTIVAVASNSLLSWSKRLLDIAFGGLSVALRRLTRVEDWQRGSLTSVIGAKHRNSQHLNAMSERGRSQKRSPAVDAQWCSGLNKLIPRPAFVFSVRRCVERSVLALHLSWGCVLPNWLWAKAILGDGERPLGFSMLLRST